MELLNERWVPIRGYEGHYEVSDYGRVKSVAQAKVTAMRQAGEIVGRFKVHAGGNC